MSDMKFIRIGNTGYCFDPERHEVRMRRNGIETIVPPYTEAMGKAYDALTGGSLGFGGIGDKGDEISEEDYTRL